MFGSITSWTSTTFVIPRQSWRDIVFASSLRASVRPFRPSSLFVGPEPYISTYWSDLIDFWYERLVPWSLDIQLVSSKSTP